MGVLRSRRRCAGMCRPRVNSAYNRKPRLAATCRSRTSHFNSRTRATSGLGSGRSRHPPLSVRSACRYVACGNSFGRSVQPCTRPDARRNEAPPSPALACTVARQADTSVGLRSMHTRTLVCPHTSPGVVSLLKGRGFRSLARRSVRKVGSCRNSGCRAHSAPGSRRRPSPPRLRRLRSNGEALCCDKPSCPPFYSRWPPCPRCLRAGGVALVAARQRKVMQSRAPLGVDPRMASTDRIPRGECQQFLRTLLRLRVQRTPPPLRASAAQGWALRCECAVGCRAAGRRQLGAWCLVIVWSMPPLPGAPDALPLGDVLDLAIASSPSRLPLR